MKSVNNTKVTKKNYLFEKLVLVLVSFEVVMLCWVEVSVWYELDKEIRVDGFKLGDVNSVVLSGIAFVLDSVW